MYGGFSPAHAAQLASEARRFGRTLTREERAGGVPLPEDLSVGGDTSVVDGQGSSLENSSVPSAPDTRGVLRRISDFLGGE